MLKRILALALALTLGLAGACAQAMTGTYAIPETPGVTPKAQAAFGATTAEPVVPDAQASYVLMTGYADLDGNAEITAIDVL